MPKIKVSDKALGHLSRGLYRSPGSALKELVSNAWDANATKITITTNYPNFLQVSCTDNGEGFTKEEFRLLMQGGIGNSTKRSKPPKLINDRPVLGRFGIGLLSIAQICGSFSITSRPKKGEGFRARITLFDLLKDKLDREDTDTVVRSNENDIEIDIGTFEFDNNFDYQNVPRGTVIVADDLNPQFTHSFRETLNEVKPSLNWSNIVEEFYKVKSLRELGDYWRLLWELSVASPVPYLSPDALPEGIIKEEHKKLLSYDFQLIVDGISLRKPVRLADNPNGYTIYKLPHYNELIYNRRLKFDGYLVVQESLEIKPAELRGVLIRIKNLAIGYYDATLLDYRINEGPRSRWLTGEIFVREGLEDALNIDRDSFNQFHPEFKALQTVVHNHIRRDIFSEVYRKIEARSKKKQKEAAMKRMALLKETIKDHLEKNVVLEQIASKTNAKSEADVQLQISSKNVKVNLPAVEALNTKKSHKELASSVLTIFELAMLQPSKEKTRETFKKLLLQLLKNW